MRSAGRPLSRDETQRLIEKHERLWTQLPDKVDSVWNDFPWPMLKPPATPDDITANHVTAYMRSPCWLDSDKKSTKDRVKEHMKRWHPDRFETKYLPKVVESEKDRVKQGAGNVARLLSDLLRKENENSSSSNIFGD
ncbi:hypothetical protein BDN70DRAFT_864944 [Pholiota conissans]|uniref:Uncharacterized protein n=1 Tax=Pholiota conissans TaxID=109636 RepID=A0A9P6CXB3_9AGAR|nr:hypothetical protein BDN70DRAFT_864944 [Pholiota conissans]